MNREESFFRCGRMPQKSQCLLARKMLIPLLVNVVPCGFNQKTPCNQHVVMHPTLLKQTVHLITSGPNVQIWKGWKKPVNFNRRARSKCRRPMFFFFISPAICWKCSLQVPKVLTNLQNFMHRTNREKIHILQGIFARENKVGRNQESKSWHIQTGKHSLRTIHRKDRLTKEWRGTNSWNGTLCHSQLVSQPPEKNCRWNSKWFLLVFGLTSMPTMFSWL